MKKTESVKTLLNYASIRNLPRTLLYEECVFDATIESSGVSHAIRRAWKELGLTAALVVDNQPTVYFVEVQKKDLENETKLHRKLWNQGTANILLVADPSEVRFYSAFATPSKEAIKENDENERRLIDTLGLSAFILQDFALRVATGSYYRERPDYFDPKNSVDSLLLDNLKAAADKLKAASPALSAQQAHSLIGRLLFLLYLWDRKIIKWDMFPKSLKFSGDMDLRQLIAHDDVSAGIASRRLFTVFKIIQHIFNGSLFGDDLEELERHVEEEHINILQQLISGKIEVSSGQRWLFPMYSFEMIPIETISSIYENFLLREDPEGKKNSGAFYTPRFLAELTVDVATEGWPTLLGKTYLDPACGSGIFLVILFNRMAEEWRARHPNARTKTRLEVLRSFLTDSLRGVDVHETAAQITCFSLYLAFLDQMEPNDIVELQELLDEKNRQSGNEKKPKEKILPKLIGKAIHPANFFAQNLTFEEPFDLIIGNPPWTGRNHPVDKVYEEWVDSKACPFTEKHGGNKKSKEENFFPNHQTITGFLWKSLCHLADPSKTCLLVPTKTLTNKGMNDFQKAWLSEATVERIVQLADFSFILFEKADCPAAIIRFNNNEPQDDTLLVHDTPKVERIDPRQSFIVIHAEGRKTVSQKDMRDAAERDRIGPAWKQLFWGTNRDSRLISRLESLADGKTLQDVIDEKGWVSAQGFKPFHQKSYNANPVKYGEPKPRLQPDSYRYIDANNKRALDLILLEKDALPIGEEFKQLHRNPEKQEIFNAPLVLVNQGFTRFVYSDFPVLFRSSLQSIACPNDDVDEKRLLLFLCGVLNSPLPRYYSFHIGSYLGIERRKVTFEELKSLPFPLPDDFSDPDEKWILVRKVGECILEAKEKLEKDVNLLRRASIIGEAKQIIKGYVYDYYEITPWEEKLIDDTVGIFAKSATPGSRNNAKLYTIAPTTPQHRKDYSDLLCKSINTWCRRSPFRVSASVKIAHELGLGLLILTKSEKKEKYTEGKVSNSEIGELLQMIQQSLLAGSDSHLAMIRRYVYFGQEHVYMIKPLELRHWTQTAALNDADEIFAAMFNAKFGEGR